MMMTKKEDQLGTREWLEENKRRVIFMDHMFKCAGRDNPDHPMHGLYTGLWHDFCINEAGRAQRDMWFERMEFVQKVASGEIKLDSPPEANTSEADPVDEYFECSSECSIEDEECKEECVEQLKEAPQVFDSPHQQAISK